MKVLLTGGKGMLGRTLVRELGGDFEVVPTDLPEADITDEDAIDAVIAQASPDAVIHCAAMTAVDKCETERDLAFRLNARGTANVAAACRRHGVRLVAISTDYVFEGDADRPYTEFDRPTGGRTVYGQSKFAGEEAVRSLCPNHVIARISWLYGAGGPSFVHAMMNLADGTRPVLKVVADQHGNPTSTVAVGSILRCCFTLLCFPIIFTGFLCVCYFYSLKLVLYAFKNSCILNYDSSSKRASLGGSVIVYLQCRRHRRHGFNP